jgi:hypothetical protein
LFADVLPLMFAALRTEHWKGINNGSVRQLCRNNTSKTTPPQRRTAKTTTLHDQTAKRTTPQHRTAMMMPPHD